jgi:hypothetical protein
MNDILMAAVCIASVIAVAAICIAAIVSVR